jgi:hypothetical protein
MSTTFAEIVCSISWKAIDDRILAALRKSARVVELWEIGGLADISHLTTHRIRVESLNRLLDQGLIRRVAPTMDPSLPRFEPRYEAVRQEVDHVE